MASTTFSGSQPSAGTGARIVGGSKGDGPGPHIMAADTLEGDSVVNSHGDDLGKIKDIMIDVASGRVAYAVLSSGGMLGMGNKLFAIPWRALVLDASRKCFILDVSKEFIDKAPGFDKDHWPSMDDANWANQIHGYYGQPNYWESSQE